jgi:hypothetical protein
MSIFRKYAYAWITLTFFLVSFFLHWWFGWQAYVDEAREHGSAPEANAYLVEMSRDTFENWQSEFLQLLWQVVGLAYFLYIGSPSSKENDDRLEAKIDALLRINAGAAEGDKLINELDYEYARDHGHALPHKHAEQVAEKAGKDVPHVCAGK